MPEIQEIVIRISGDTSGITSQLNALKTQLSAMGQNVSASNAKLVQSTQAMEKSVSASYNQMTRMAHMFQSALFYMAGHAIFRTITRLFDDIVNYGLKFNSMMQQNQIALETMLGSASRASVLLEKVWVIAAKTPFQFKELSEITKQLIAFQMSAEKIPEFLWAVSDATAALGGGFEKAQNISLAFAKMLSLGVIQLREIRTLGRNGINEIQALMDYLGKSEAQIYEMIQKKAVSAYDAINAFVKYAAEKYPGMANKMALLYEGLVSTLKDYWERLMGDMTSGIFELAQDAFPVLIEKVESMSALLTLKRDDIIKWWKDLYSAVKTVADGLGILLVPALKLAFGALGAVLQGFLDFVNNNKELTKVLLTTIVAIGEIKLAMKLLSPVINVLILQQQGLAAGTLASSVALHSFKVALSSVLGQVAIAVGAIAGLVSVFTTLNNMSGQVGFTYRSLREDVMNLSQAQDYLMQTYNINLQTANEILATYINVQKDMAGNAEYVTGHLDMLARAFLGIAENAVTAAEAMAGFREEGIKLLDKIEDEIYALTHSPYEAELRTLEQQKEHYVDVLRSNMVDPWQDISEEKLKIEQWFQLKKAELDNKYAGKTTAGYSAALAEYKKHITEMLKLAETLEKELYNLTHSSRAVQTKELERERDERRKIAEDNASLLEQIEAVHQLKMKALRDEWAAEDLAKQQEFLDKKKKAQEDYVKFEVESWNRMYEKNTADMKKYYDGRKEFQDMQDELYLTEEQKMLKDIDAIINRLISENIITSEEAQKFKTDYVLDWRSKQAIANYTSLLQMQKDMEEFLKEFDMEKFKANAQKVIDLSIEAAKFISTLTINLDPAVAEKLKEINKTFNEVTIGNLTEMITSFTNFYKAIEEAAKTKQVDPAQVDKLINDLTDFIVMFVSKTIEWAKALKGDNYLLPAIKEINETFKDVTLNEFVATLKSIFDLMKYINEVKLGTVDPVKIDDIINYFTDFIVMFVERTIEWGKAIRGDNYLLPALKELNETFKDTSINEFMTTLKNMFDLMEYINKLEYTPVTGEQLDIVLTRLTEFMVLLANRTAEWVEALQKDSLLESMRELNKTFKDTNLNEFIGTIKSVFDLVALFEKAPNINPSIMVDNITDFLLHLESFVIALDNAIIAIGSTRLSDIATRARETFTYLNTLFKDINLDEFMKMVKSLDEVITRFTPKFDEQGKEVADLLSDVANVASRIKWFFTQLDTLAKELEKMFSGEEGKYLEAVSARVKSSFDKLNNAFKDINLADFTAFMTMLKDFEESVMKDKNGRLMTSIDIDKVKEAIIGMLKSLESLSKELDEVMNGDKSVVGASFSKKTSWIDTLKEKLENTVGRVDEIMKYVAERMMNIRNSWNLITGTVTDMKGVYLSTILECITGLNELLDSPLWKGIIDKVENVYLKVAERLIGIQTGFTNMRVSVEETINKLAKNLTLEFNGVIDAIGNAEGLIGDKLTNLGNTIDESDAVKKIGGLVSEINNLTKGMDNMVLKIGTWIVAFTKFCFTIAYLATLAFRAVEQFNLEMEKMLKMASAFKAFVQEIKPLMEEMIKLFGTWGELMTKYGDLVDTLTKSGASQSAFWKDEEFGTNPWDWAHIGQDNQAGNTEVGAGGFYDDQGNYHPGPQSTTPIVINGDLVLQGVQNPQQLIDELKRMGNMRGAINVNYNY